MKTIAFALILICGTVQANVDRVEQYRLEYKNQPKKSWRMIIKEVIKRKDKKMPFPKIEKTFPIPWYDSIDDNRLKNLA